MQRILLVAIDRSAAEQMSFSFPNIHFDAVATAAEALHTLRSGRFAAAVIGEDPPDMPGVELVRQARSIAQLEQMPMELVRGPESVGLQARIAAAMEAAGAPSASVTSTQMKWNALVDQFRRLTSARLMDLKRVECELRAGEVSTLILESAQRAAHNIAGSATLFGYADASNLARRLEELLQTEEPLKLKGKVIDLIQTLEAELGFDPLSQPIPDFDTRPQQQDLLDSSVNPAHRSSLNLLYVDDDPELLKSVEAVAGPQGVTVLSAETVTEAREHLRAHRPDTAVIDLTFSHDPEAILGLVDELRHMQPPVPMVVLTPDGQLEQRLVAARMGATRFLQKPVAPGEIVSTATQLVTYQRENRATVLAVDDDPMILDTLCELLNPMQINVITCSDPFLFWQMLEESKPELVLLDVDMGNLSGLDLCRVLRSDRQYQSIPVIFLTSRSDVETLTAAFAAGADDFIGKPLIGPELAARVHGRLERNRLMRQLAETDPLTGAFNRRKFTDLVGRYLRLADRQRLPLSVAILDIDRFKQVNDTHGHLVGDAVLQRLVGILKAHLRAEDIVGRWGGEEFAVVMIGATKAGAGMRLTRVMEAFRSDPALDAIKPTYSAGVAEYPRDGHNLMELQKVADASLYDAKHAGRSRVFAAGAIHQELQQIDVALVTANEKVARDVKSGLEARGLVIRTFAEVESARAALAGAAPTHEARLAIIDTELHGTGGLALLRIMREHGVLKHTRTLLLSSNGSEVEREEGLQAGAIGFLHKPLSQLSLVEAVRKAMEE